MLGVIASYHRIQFQEKLVVQTQENGEKPHFGPDLDHQFFLQSFQLDIVSSYHPMQFRGKLVNQT